MKRAFIAGAVDRHGIAHPTCFCSSVSGTCAQGRRCPLRDTELANEEPPREQFATPLRTRTDDEFRRRHLAWVLIVNAVALASLAGLIWAGWHA